jgi:two-component system chemotaxis response regulator CheY
VSRPFPRATKFVIWHEIFWQKTMRVLIADDQKSVGASLADLVELCHHEVVEVVGSGLEAIQAYTRYRPDVVLMDYWMPKLNGATACRNILAKDPSARIILVSGWSPSNDTAVQGAVTVLPKPVRLERLEAVLDALRKEGVRRENTVDLGPLNPVYIELTPLSQPQIPEAA